VISDIVDVQSPAIRAAADSVAAEAAVPAVHARALFEFVRDRVAYTFIPPDFEGGRLAEGLHAFLRTRRVSM
jgi:hypothetical protein